FELLSTPSPTGFETKIQAVVKRYMSKYADEIEVDLHGNMMVALNPKANRRVMLAGHCDQIGLMVSHISKDGFVYVTPLGGIDVGVLPGAIVTIHSQKGPVQGVIGRKPIHLQKDDERSKMSLDIKAIWVDIGAKNEKEAKAKIEIGDCATFALQVTELQDGFVCSPGMDDKVGLFVAMEALRLCASSKLQVGLYSVSTVQEEVGLRGARTAAYRIDPEVGIAIDVTHAHDNPGRGGDKESPCDLGKGPVIVRGPAVNPVVDKMLVATAKKHKIPYQLEANSRMLGNDANAIQVTRGGVAAASLGIPNRYMHTQVEMCHLKDLENAAKLLANFVKSITNRTDFRPK
ncbi:MAG: M42 family metallopeptidase, partial [Bdellovibrionales bacterium]|nr:M42 family metallopeptidase [Bdellovibrionales bacterium]